MDAYDFLNEHIQKLPYIRKITRINGLTALEGLTDDVRNNDFPCIAVDNGCDGALDLTSGLTDRRYHTFYVLVKIEPTEDVNTKSLHLEFAKTTGIKVLGLMKNASVDLSDPFYGLDLSTIQYSRFGPIGFGCYGYAFNYTVNCDVF